MTLGHKTSHLNQLLNLKFTYNRLTKSFYWWWICITFLLKWPSNISSTTVFNKCYLKFLKTSSSVSEFNSFTLLNKPSLALSFATDLSVSHYFLLCKRQFYNNILKQYKHKMFCFASLHMLLLSYKRSLWSKHLAILRESYCMCI